MDEARYPLRQPHGFRPQGGGQKPKQWPAPFIDNVARLYAEGLCQWEIGAFFGYSQRTIWRVMQWYDIKADPGRAYERVPKGAAHPNWKGARASAEAKRRRR